MSRRLSRREALNVGVGAFAAGLASAAGPARAVNDYADQIRKFTGGKTPVEGRVKLELPELAENGNTVPLSVAVDGLPAKALMCRKSWWSRPRTRTPG